MRSGMIALVLGLLSLRLLPVLPPPWLLGLLVLLAVGLVFTRINSIGWFVLGAGMGVRQCTAGAG
ncbi:hypothetical protein [Pseudomonas marincola]|uniref:hypothetical protein n=1 Tax=Pseudomonas marincola TaxID=437900 RepID=UPI0008EA2474|nr:competence protein ComEC [Pseudomonas marincola]